jgi:hypothetical protein
MPLGQSYAHLRLALITNSAVGQVVVRPEREQLSRPGGSEEIEPMKVAVANVGIAIAPSATMLAPLRRCLPVRDIWLLRLHALVAHAHGDAAACAQFGIATATWRNRLASRGTSHGPRRCNDGSRRGMRTSCPQVV